MQIVHTLPDLRAARQRLGACTLVPTMGSLHQGHLSLIAKAREAELPVAVSIFVNRLQFAPTDDFDRYPRTLSADCEMLEAAGCDLVFAPAEADLYPQAQRFQVVPDPALADILEGQARPGFFVGVCTVVMKLFCCVQPEIGVFGKKDFQQLMVLRRMVEQFAMPIEVQAEETLRGPDGLALSSRNGYLSAAEQAQATQLSQSLKDLIDAYRHKPAPLAELEARALARLSEAGWAPDYLTIRRRVDLQPPDQSGSNPHPAGIDGQHQGDSALVALGAARLGTTRLIDSIEF